MADSALRKPKSAAKRAPRAARPDTKDVQGLAGRIPQVSIAQAEALRGLFAAARRWPLDDGSVLQFAPGNASAAAETFTVDAEGTPLQLRLDAPMPAAATPPDLHWSDYRGRARLLAWSLAHEGALVRLSDAIGTSLVPTEDAATTDGDDAVWLGFCIEDRHDSGREAAHPGARVNGSVRLPVAWLPRLQARAAPVYEDDPLPADSHWRALPVSVTLGFDGPPLGHDDWQRLQLGDVIVIGHGRMPEMRARTARRMWPLAATPDGWRITSAVQTLSSFPEHSSMNETDAPNDDRRSESDDGEAIARNLPVQLAFEIGQVEINVGEVAGLQPGYVFSLPANLEGANVTIRANGHAAGRGEVVAVGNTLGVRLLGWN